jgi:sulfide:quinone oxidoreductase
MAFSRPTRVLVAGGGVAALETVLALQSIAGDRLEIELLAPGRHFTYRPLAVAEPFRAGSVRRIPLAAIAHDRGVRLQRDAIARVLPDERAVETQGGVRLDYDALVLALGARPVEAIPGALTFRGPQDAGRVADIVEQLRRGALRRLAFVVPSGTTWTLPLYELALQTADALRGSGPQAELTVVTPEPGPLATFGREASETVGTLLAERGVRLRTGALVDEYDAGELRLGAGGSLTADRVIALPRLLGPCLRGLPSDPLGFVPVDELTRVIGIDGVHAVGDMTTHALKQGGLATQQADVAASVIAAAAGVSLPLQPYRPVLRGLLLTGGETRFLRKDPDGASEVSNELLWWPPAKIAGRHLAPYLAGHLDLAAPRRPDAAIPLRVEPAPAAS